MPVSVALRKGVGDIWRSHLHDGLAKAQSALVLEHVCWPRCAFSLANV
jgi:hypothetical protein